MNTPKCSLKETAGQIFVVGMNGSGTGVLVKSLNQHPNLYAFPGETKILPYYLQNLNKFGDLNKDDNFRKLWDKIRKDFVFTAWNGGVDVPLPDSWLAGPRNIPSVFDGVFGFFAKREGKIRWCEKTPMHVLHLPLLKAQFPEAKFLHIIRDGRDAAASFNRRWNYRPEMTVYRWRNALRTARVSGLSLPDDCYFELRYEELVREPEHSLRQVCEFIGETFHQQMLQPAWPDGRVRLASGFVSNSGNWKTYFNPEMICRLEDIAGKTLRDNGYEVSSAAQDNDPPGFVRKYWVFCDRARMVTQLFKSALRNPRQGLLKSMGRLMGQLSKALRQFMSQK